MAIAPRTHDVDISRIRDNVKENARALHRVAVPRSKIEAFERPVPHGPCVRVKSIYFLFSLHNSSHRDSRYADDDDVRVRDVINTSISR